MSILEEITERYLANPDDDSVLELLRSAVLASNRVEELISLCKKFEINHNAVHPILERCLDITDNNSEVYSLLAKNYWFTDKQKSEQYAYRAIELDETNIDAMNTLLGIYITQLDGEKIKTVAQKALSLDPKNRMARLMHIYVLVFEGSRQQAIQLLNDGIVTMKNIQDLVIDDEETVKIFQYKIIGIKKGIDYQRLFLYPKMTHDDKSVLKKAEEVLEKNPTHLIALVTYAKLYTVFIDDYSALSVIRDAYKVYKERGEAIPQVLIDLEQAIINRQVLDISDIKFSLIEKMGK